LQMKKLIAPYMLKDSLRKILIVSVFCLLSAVPESLSQVSILATLGTAFPTGEFAREQNPWNVRTGSSGTGLVIGPQFVYKLKDSGLGIFAGADIVVNNMSKDARSIMDDVFNGADFEYPRTMIIPVTAGLNYIFKADEKVSFYGKAGFVTSFLKITDLHLKSSDYNKYSEEYDFSSSYGFLLGAGLIAEDKLILGVSYYGLGEHKTSGIWKDGDDEGKLNVISRNIELITVTAGWKFW
jgi:hypothetical protein